MVYLQWWWNLWIGIINRALEQNTKIKKTFHCRSDECSHAFIDMFTIAYYTQIYWQWNDIKWTAHVIFLKYRLKPAPPACSVHLTRARIYKSTQFDKWSAHFLVIYLIYFFVSYGIWAYTFFNVEVSSREGQGVFAGFFYICLRMRRV